MMLSERASSKVFTEISLMRTMTRWLLRLPARSDWNPAKSETLGIMME